MTVPNVTIVWCRKKATCKWCEQPIDIATAMVRVFFWNKGEDGNRKWNAQFCYHVVNQDGTHCWDEQGLDYLRRNPYVPHRRGRKPSLSVEDTRKRYLLVRKFHALSQRRKNMNHSYPDSLLVDERLTKQMVNIMMEIVPLGGVPKSWVEKLT